jgi:hypothetical protein
MKEMFLVEYGSSYSSDPWEPVCVCESEEMAEKYIADNDLSIFRNLYHITKIPLYEGK